MPTVVVKPSEKEWLKSLRRPTPGKYWAFESVATVMERIHANYKDVS